MAGATRTRILAIAGSQRHGNSELLAKTALEGAAGTGAEVELLSLAGKRVGPCLGECYQSCHGVREAPWRSCSQQDDAPTFLERMVAADGIMFVSPVFHSSLPGAFKCLLDRSNALSRFEDEEIGSLLAGKAAGAIAVGGARHCGQEAVLGQLVDFILAMQMLPVGFAERQGYRGLAVLAERAGSVLHDRWTDYGVKAASAMDFARLFGAKLAREARVVKLGRAALQSSEREV